MENMSIVTYRLILDLVSYNYFIPVANKIIKKIIGIKLVLTNKRKCCKKKKHEK